MLGGMAASGVAATAAPVSPNWSNLRSAFSVPDWFRDAKFGIWAHWSAQCVPEAGDWYGRLMYVQGHPMYAHHLAHYGHPADTGFIEIENRWKAEHWQPEALIDLYKRAGAKYFMALGCHHDNLDAFDSAHHAWNSTRVGPKRDIVGTWEKAVRRAGLRFGISNHSSHAWHWWQTAYGYDAEGPRAGERYDAFKLTKADGKGTWWDGLDPQDLYCGPSFVSPDGIGSIAAMNAWHDVHDGRWMEFVPPQNPAFAANWLARQKDMVEKYRPDVVYLDDTGLPFGSYGIEALAHYYAQGKGADGGLDVVLTAKKLTDYQRGALVEDVERGFSDRLRPEPWQTCTCIGDWHYNRARFEQKSYVPAEQVIQRLCDVVAKNGNLLLSIPVRGDGTIDSEEEKIVAGITRWMARNGEAAIYRSRPWRIFGEGPTAVPVGVMNEGEAKPFTAEDVRFTVKDGALCAILLAWPTGPVTIAALGRDALPGATIEHVRLVGGGPLAIDRSDAGLRLALPPAGAGDVVPVVRIEGRGLAAT
ncbi:alpha-L-fucosidase [Hephaestia caeni]|uniref:alpha-L-fucosidase n=1 Tax=Hephaestia caeni TaxID=645617 RepID=A0A397PD99_9SPHN|nr:alpha-L-fucosidase [Hephaestia caeni]RIA45899.1 alpha-L-fucosidase [Hephaestia caeni]